jgi:hypothetical protein
MGRRLPPRWDGGGGLPSGLSGITNSFVTKFEPPLIVSSRPRRVVTEVERERGRRDRCGTASVAAWVQSQCVREVISR